MFSSSSYSMEDGNTKYILPLDAIDLAYLPVNRRYYGENDTTIPVWKKESDTLYLEFELTQTLQEPDTEVTQPEENLNLSTYLKIIKALSKTPQTLNLKVFDEDTIIMHVQNKKVYVSVNNFHGYVKSEDKTLCRICRVVTKQRETHMLSEKHMDIVSKPLNDVNCIRQVDQIWSHCILCNEMIENKDFHVTYSSEHELRLRDTLWTTPVSNSNNFGVGNKFLQSLSNINGQCKVSPEINNAFDSNTRMENYNKHNRHETGNNSTARISIQHSKQAAKNTVLNNNITRMADNANDRQKETTSNKADNILSNSKMERNNHAILKPGMANCFVCNRTMRVNALRSHQRACGFRLRKKTEEIQSDNNKSMSLKPASNSSEDPKVCEKTHYNSKVHKEYLQKHNITEEKAGKDADTDEIVNGSTPKNMPLGNSKNSVKNENTYYSIDRNLIFCNICELRMHKNNLQSHLTGRYHKENTERLKILENKENKKSENRNIPLHNVVEKDIESNNKQLVFYNSKYALIESNFEKNDLATQVKKEQAKPEPSNVDANKICKDENNSTCNNINILVSKQEEEANKNDTEVSKDNSMDDKTDLTPKQDVDEKIRNLVAKKPNIQTVNINSYNEVVKSVKSVHSGPIEKQQDQASKTEDIEENIRKLVEKKKDIDMQIRDKLNESLTMKNIRENLNVDDNIPDKTQFKRIEEDVGVKLKTPSDTDDIDVRIRNLVTHKTDINLIEKSNITPWCRKRDPYSLDPQHSEHIIKSINVEEDIVHSENNNNFGMDKDTVTDMKKNASKFSQQSGILEEAEKNLDIKCSKNVIKTEPIEHVLGENISNLNTGQGQDDMNTPTKLYYTTGTKVDSNSQLEVKSEIEISIPKRKSFTDKIKSFVTHESNKNDTARAEENLSVSEAEIAEESQNVPKLNKKLDLATRLRNYFARKRAKRNKTDTEEKN